MAGDKTEKATPKKREESRKKGQVAKSQDLNGAAVMLGGLLALSATGPAVVSRCEEVFRNTIELTSRPDPVTMAALGPLLLDTFGDAAAAVGPVALACCVAAVAINVAQVRFKITPKAVEPNFKKLNPIQGAKNIFGPNAAVEGVKSVSKVLVVGAIAASALIPALPELGALVGMEAQEVGRRLGSMVMGIAQRACVAYLVIGVGDFFWQRHRMEKQMKMDKQEVRDEQKSYALPAEVKMAQRRRAQELARARMMADVPEADVVVTNPTHFSVALKYGDGMLAPKVVAKGQDLVALKIREIAAEHGVPVLPNPPLARALHGGVEVGHPIPEEFFQAVAQVLAFVYRVAGRKTA
jgi:flagellar biosynthesis protein FlhB